MLGSMDGNFKGFHQKIIKKSCDFWTALPCLPVDAREVKSSLRSCRAAERGVRNTRPSLVSTAVS